MQKVLFLSFMVVLSACTSQETEDSLSEDTEREVSKNIEEELNAFDEYLADLSSEDLPIEIDCSTPFLSLDVSYEKHSAFIPEGSQPHAVYNKTGEFPLIFYSFPADIVFPVLYSYNTQGEIIDSLWMYNGSCVGDPWLESDCRTVLKEDLTIEMEDTIRYFFFNDTIRRLDSILLETEIYQLNANGKFDLMRKDVARMQ